MKRIRFVVRGRVQGVGFRFFAKSTAEAHGVLGWVRNEPDGSVCGEAQGTDAELGAFLAALRAGPRYGRVEDLQTEPLDLGADVEFRIRRDSA